MIDNYIQILDQYKHPKISYLFTEQPLPPQWQITHIANKIDTVNSQTDYLVDLYHYREISKLMQLQQIEKLELEFSHDLTQEEFILMLLRFQDVNPAHLPYFINGSRRLYEEICWKYQINRVSFTSFVNFYFTCQQESKFEAETMFNLDQRSQLQHFEQFKKEKYGFVNSVEKDIVHHNTPIKRVFKCQDWIISLDEMSNCFRIYDSQLQLERTVECTSEKHKSNMHLLDIFWAETPKNIGACCQDKSICIWTMATKFQIEYMFPAESLQIMIVYVETIKAWITVNQQNKLIQWQFTFLIETSENKLGTGLTNSSTAVGSQLPYSGTAKIACIKEIAALKKLFISCYNQTVTIWNPIKRQIFAIIEIPIGHSSVHTIVYSNSLNIIFSVGFDQEMLMWQLDEINEDYNKVGQITISEPGITVSAIEIFDEYGMLISLDDSGVMRCWDLESWTIMYRFDLNCKIKNTLSQMIKLEGGRFLLTTSRIQLLHFPTKTPRKLKHKFKPLDHMHISSNLLIGSHNEVYAMNLDNSIIEHKLNLENVRFFFELHKEIIVIISQGDLFLLNDRKRNRAQLSFQQQDYVSFPLLDNQDQLKGQQFHRLYEQLSIWSKTQMRIYQFSFLNKKLSFNKIRQLTLPNEIVKVINQPERNVIAILMQDNTICFVSFDQMKTIERTHFKEEVLDFFILVDYDVIILQLSGMLLFISHTQHRELKILFKIQIGSCDVDIQSINYESLDRVMNEFYEGQRIYLNQQFYKDLEEVNENRFTKVEDYQTITNIRKLQQENAKLNSMDIRNQKSMKSKFVSTVNRIIEMIKSNSLESSLTSPMGFQLEFDVGDVVQVAQSTMIPLRSRPQINAKVDKERNHIDIDQFGFHPAHIKEDIHSNHYLVLRNNMIRVTNLQSVFRDLSINTRPYANKGEYTKLFLSLEDQKVREFNVNECPQIKLQFIEINHHSINPKIINFYGRLFCLSFGFTDNLLKIWDISNLKPNTQLILSKHYISYKYQQLQAKNKLKELQDIFSSEQIINQQIFIVERMNKQVQKMKNYVPFMSTTFVEGLYIVGEYLLPLEQKLLWNLKEYNPQYRIQQMKETTKLLKQMTLNWQEANKYQSHLLEHQIFRKQRLMNQQFVTQPDEIREFSSSVSSVKGEKLQFIIKSDNESNHSSKVSHMKIMPPNKVIMPKKKQTKFNGNPNILHKTLTIPDDRASSQDQDPFQSQQKIDQLLKNSSKRLQNFNKALLEIYYPGQRIVPPEVEKRGRNYDLAEMKNRSSSGQKIKQLLKFNYDAEIERSCEKLNKIMKTNREKRSLTPLKDFLKPKVKR